MIKHVRRILVLLVLAAAVWAGYIYLKPLMRVQEEQVYTSYTVSRGDILTEKSFSASISVAYSEKHQNTTRATAIREIYVTSGQSVRKGDKLMLLDNGELLKAGLDGVVTEMRFDTSDWLWNNVDLIQISDLTHLKVSLSVDEYDVRNVTAGQKCFVTIVPTGEVFETEIAHVDRVSASGGQVAYYTASAELIATENALPGMTACVTIPSDRVEDVLVLDMAALGFNEEKQPYVLRKTEEGYEQVLVTTGLCNGMQVEVTSGLDEGDVVWVASAQEKVQSTYTLSDLYKMLVGEKIVINDMTGNQNNRNGFSMPERNDTNTPDEGEDGSRGMPQRNTTPDGEQSPAVNEGQSSGESSWPRNPADNDGDAAVDEGASSPAQSPTQSLGDTPAINDDAEDSENEREEKRPSRPANERKETP